MAAMRLSAVPTEVAPLPTPGMSLAQAANLLLENLEYARRASRYTLKDYRDDLRLFTRFVEEHVHPGKPATLADFNRTVIQAFLVEMGRLGRAPKSVQHYLTTLRTLGRFLVELDVLAVNPAQLVRGPRLPQTVAKPITEEELDTFFAAIPHTREGERHRAYFTLLVATGMRLGESINLKLADVDLANGMLWVRRGKGQKDRMIPVAPDVVPVLAHYVADVRHAPATEDDAPYLWISRSGHRLAQSTVRVSLDTICRRAGLDAHRLHPHAWRATFATRHARRGAAITVIQTLMGHVNVNTTAHYVGTSPEQMRQAIDSMPMPGGAVR